RVERFAVAGLHRGIDLSGRHPQAGSGNIKPVVTLRRLDQGGVAARCDVVYDGAGRPLDIGGDFALGGEKSAKTLVEIGASSVQANGHGGFLLSSVELYSQSPDRPSR